MSLTPHTAAARRRALLPCLALSLAVLQGSALAAADFEEDFDDPNKPWEEIAVQLPPAPQEQDLLPFEVSGNATHRFFIDARSVSVGKDGVIRYTLVTISSAGARNVSYEGLRCETFEVKRYAFGQPDGSWSRSRRDQWQWIVRNAANRQHAILAREYMCQEKAIAGPAEDIVARIRDNRSLNPNALP